MKSLWCKRALTSPNVLWNLAFKNLPQTSANNLEMHKLFIKAASQNIFRPLWFRLDICVTFVLFRLPGLWLSHGGGGGEEPGRVSAMVAMNPDSRAACSGLTALPLLPLENKLSENPFHNTEPTINTDLCRILFHCFQNSCALVESEPNVSGPTCMSHTYDKRNGTNASFLVSWSFSAIVKPAQCAALHKMSGCESWQTFSTPHSDALQLSAFPSAVPLIFHIRLLIITASLTICFWTNLPLFQINISRQVKRHLSSPSLHRGL